MSSPHDFDFLHGDWEVANRRLTDFLQPTSGWVEFTGTSHCQPFFDGAANVDEIDMPYLGSKGLTLRLFDRETAQWSLNWSSSGTGKLFPPVTGQFVGGQGSSTATTRTTARTYGCGSCGRGTPRAARAGSRRSRWTTGRAG